MEGGRRREETEKDEEGEEDKKAKEERREGKDNLWMMKRNRKKIKMEKDNREADDDSRE